MSDKIQGLKMEVSVVLKNKDSLKYLQNTISEFTALQSVINKCFSLLEKNIKYMNITYVYKYFINGK